MAGCSKKATAVGRSTELVGGRGWFKAADDLVGAGVAQVGPGISLDCSWIIIARFHRGLQAPIELLFPGGLGLDAAVLVLQIANARIGLDQLEVNPLIKLGDFGSP